MHYLSSNHEEDEDARDAAQQMPDKAKYFP